jgi:hypothetical protein
MTHGVVTYKKWTQELSASHIWISNRNLNWSILNEICSSSKFDTLLTVFRGKSVNVYIFSSLNQPGNSHVGCLSHPTCVYMRLIQSNVCLHCWEIQYLPPKSYQHISIPLAFQLHFSYWNREQILPGVTQSPCALSPCTSISSHDKFLLVFT